MTDLVASPPRHAALPLGRTGLIETALALGGFGIGTGEFAMMGVLPDIAGSFGVSEPRAGTLISAYALGVVVGSPLIAVLAARLRRRSLLLGLMAAFAVFNVASAVAPNIIALVILRFLAGMPHGAFFGVSSLVAASMAAPNKRAQAVGRVMLGLTGATLLGAPLATAFGLTVGWRATLAMVGAIATASALLIALFMRPDAPRREASPLQELGAFRRRQVWLTAGIAAVGCGGTFAVYSYITSTLTLVGGMPLAAIPLVLAVFGAGTILGNLAGARLADRALMPLIGGMLLWAAVALALFSVTARHPVFATLDVFLIGCGFAILPGLQTRLMDVAPGAQTLAAALNHSAFNIANALGAWLGGLAIAGGYGFAATGWVGSLLALGGFGVFLLSWLLERQAPTAAAPGPRAPPPAHA